MTVGDDWRLCSHKEAKCFQNLCNLRNSGRKRTQTFLCMPDQSRTPKIAALVFCPLPENRTRELRNWGPQWKTPQMRSLRKPKNTSVEEDWSLSRVLISGRFSLCVIAVSLSFFPPFLASTAFIFSK